MRMEDEMMKMAAACWEKCKCKIMRSVKWELFMFMHLLQIKKEYTITLIFILHTIVPPCQCTPFTTYSPYHYPTCKSAKYVNAKTEVQHEVQ